MKLFVNLLILAGFFHGTNHPPVNLASVNDATRVIVPFKL